MTREIPLSRRQADYAQALRRAQEASEAYLTARASGKLAGRVVEEMDAVQAELRRAKRRLEEMERRLAKRAGG